MGYGLGLVPLHSGPSCKIWSFSCLKRRRHASASWKVPKWSWPLAALRSLSSAGVSSATSSHVRDTRAASRSKARWTSKWRQWCSTNAKRATSTLLFSSGKDLPSNCWTSYSGCSGSTGSYADASRFHAHRHQLAMRPVPAPMSQMDLQLPGSRCLRTSRWKSSGPAISSVPYGFQPLNLGAKSASRPSVRALPSPATSGSGQRDNSPSPHAATTFTSTSPARLARM
mmetsp:Transcript_93974/g.265812  ORF Transcript_93974/g.265812 Transcript_93974/m.265812 type:complete len:227 (-) Transcript_93974:141-821(-)